MIGNGYWSTGITVWHAGGGRDEWFAEAQFLDDGFAQDGSSEGVVQARYAGALSTVVDTVKADVERLGIRWRGTRRDTPSLYYKGDGEDRRHPPPKDWRERVGAEAKRLGWEDIYTKETGT